MVFVQISTKTFIIQGNASDFSDLDYYNSHFLEILFMMISLMQLLENARVEAS